MTTEQRKSALTVLMAVAETVRESKTTPSGPLYAVMMSKGCTLAQYEGILKTLEGAGLVRVSASKELLTWVGPGVH